MTSNIGSRQLKDFGQGVGFNTVAKKSAKIRLCTKVLLKMHLKKHLHLNS